MGVPKKKEKKEKLVKKSGDKVKKPESTTDESSFRGIVRIAGKDIKGETKLKNALFRVRGIGHTLAISVQKLLFSSLSVSPDSQVGDLTDEQIEQVDKILFNLHETKIPAFLFNRQKERTTGKNVHVVMSDLEFAFKQDIEKEKKLYTWKGYRHSYGQKVRGQRTRNTGRGGMAVGVLRKAITDAQKQQTAGAPAKTAAAAPAPAAAKTAAPAKK